MKPLPFVLAAVVSASSLFAAVDPGQLESARKLYGEKKYPDAQKAFETIAAADAKCAEAQHFLAQLALRRNDADAALAAAEKAVALAPDNADYQHTFGDSAGFAAQKASIFRQPGLAKKCVAGYQRAVELKPDNIKFHEDLLEFYRQAPSIVGGGMDKALAEAATIKKLDANRGRLAFATLYVADKKYDRALAEFDDALKTAPDDYNALYQVGRLAAVSGQFLERGLASLRRCLELTPPAGAPGHAAAHWRIGNILERKSETAAAKTAYEAALTVDPKFSPAADALKKLK